MYKWQVHWYTQVWILWFFFWKSTTSAHLHLIYLMPEIKLRLIVDSLYTIIFFIKRSPYNKILNSVYDSLYWLTAHVRYWLTAHVRYWLTAHVRYWLTAHVRYWLTAHVRYWCTAHVRYWCTAHVRYWLTAHVRYWLTAHVRSYICS